MDSKQPALKKAATKKTGPAKPVTMRSVPNSPPRWNKVTPKIGIKTASTAKPPQRPKCVIILRGLPGSGKSTLAEQLAAAARTAGRSAAIHSTDSFFTDPCTGEYRFEFGMLQRNHERNYEAFCSSLKGGIHTVIVDNTNILRKHYENYQAQATQQGYRVRIEEVGELTRSAAALYAVRNVHGVLYDKVMQMLEQWREEEAEEESGGYSDASCSGDDSSNLDDY